MSEELKAEAQALIGRIMRQLGRKMVDEQVAEQAVMEALASRTPTEAEPGEAERRLVAFVQPPQWADDADPPEDNADWRAGYEAAQSNLREELKSWWPLAGTLSLAAQGAPIEPGEAEVERVARAIGEAERSSCGGYPSTTDSDPKWNPWLTDKHRMFARAAIAALRSTTPVSVAVDDGALVDELTELAAWLEKSGGAGSWLKAVRAAIDRLQSLQATLFPDAPNTDDPDPKHGDKG